LIASTFGESACLYKDVLQCHPKATSSELRKSYYKRAKCFHPDRQEMESLHPDERNNTLCFQAVSATYEFLCDRSNRSKYDSKGTLDNEDIEHMSATKARTTRRKTNHEWTDFFRSVFQELVKGDDCMSREDFCESSQEKKEVLKFYAICKGNLEKVVNCILLAEDADIPRWKENILIPHIQIGDIVDFNGLLKTAPTKKRKHRNSYRIDVQNDVSHDKYNLRQRKRKRGKECKLKTGRKYGIAETHPHASSLRSMNQCVDTDQEEEAKASESRTQDREQKLNSLKKVHAYRLTEDAKQISALVDTDDEEEGPREKQPKLKKLKKGPIHKSISKQKKSGVVEMSKRDKVEYRIAKMQKEKKLKDAQLAKMIKGKRWGVAPEVPTKSRRHQTSFTNDFLLNLERKFS